MQIKQKYYENFGLRNYVRNYEIKYNIQCIYTCKIYRRDKLRYYYNSV
jgi:hypothetical protein